jgi:hypothetical protein
MQPPGLGQTQLPGVVAEPSSLYPRAQQGRDRCGASAGAQLVIASLDASAVPPPHEEVFGLWRDRSQDALEMEESLRQEWSQL